MIRNMTAEKMPVRMVAIGKITAGRITVREWR